MMNHLGGGASMEPLAAQVVAASFALTDVANLRWDVDFVNVAKLFQDTARTSPVTAAGQKVMGIADGSPILNHLAQSTSGRAPTYRASGFGTKSVSYGEFDGTDDHILSATHPVYGATEWTAYLVYRSRETGTSNLAPIIHGESGNAKGVNIYDFHETIASGNDDSIGLVAGDGGANHVRTSTTNSVPPNTPVIATLAWKDGQNPPVILRINGVNQTPLGGNGAGAFSVVWDSPDFGASISKNPASNYIANTLPKIDVARVVFYTGQHTSAEWNQIEPYLANYVGITI